MRGSALILILCIAVFPGSPASAAGLGGSPVDPGVQEGDAVNGKVTYVSGDVYYISLGSKEGMEDSLVVSVISGADTIAGLKIFAVSSKSSACRMVSGARKPVIGDLVYVTTKTAPPDVAGMADPGAAAATMDDTGGGKRIPVSPQQSQPAGPEAGPGTQPSRPPPFRVGGRVTAQYQTYLYDDSPGGVTSPSLSVSLRGEARDLPVRFEFTGSLRSSVTGSSAPFAGDAVNRSRIYRLNVLYDDGHNRFGFGRLIPAAGLPSGYLDGLVMGRRIGVFEFGVAGGYEPDFTQRSFSADRRKFVVFAGTGSRGGGSWSLNAGFSKTYLHSAPERSVAAASAYFAPSPAFSFDARTEVDFLNMKNSQAITRPKLSSLLANMNYRISGEITLGVGVTAWRPVYPLSTMAGLADSLFDTKLWVSPTATVRVFTAGGLSLQERYSPRSTPEGFGNEYFNMLSLGLNDAFGSGVSIRGNQTLNRSSIASTTGYGVSLQRMVWNTVSAGLRYRYYRYVFDGSDAPSTTRSVTADVSFPVGRALFMMLSAEFFRAATGDYRIFAGGLSWRF